MFSAFLTANLLTLIYCLFGAYVLNVWLTKLPPEDPMILTLQGQGFGAAMLWALYTVFAVFILTWPAWVLVRGTCLTVRMIVERNAWVQRRLLSND